MYERCGMNSIKSGVNLGPLFESPGRQTAIFSKSLPRPPRIYVPLPGSLRENL